MTDDETADLDEGVDEVDLVAEDFLDDEDDDGGEDLYDDLDDEDDDGDGPVPLDAAEEGGDQLDGQPVVDLGAIDEDLEVDDPMELAADDDADDDMIRDGEFVCSSCHMAKRASALADADEMLCRDCV